MTKKLFTPTLPKLLIVDDELMNIRILLEIFKNTYEIFFTTKGSEILEMCQKHIPDLILLDILMPETSGIEICRLLKTSAESREVPIIFITKKGEVEDEIAGFEAGAADFISKPISAPIVKARVDTHIKLKERADQLRQLALIDGLTGIANRRHFDNLLEQEWRWCRRYKETLALFMIDVDHFKLFNDTYGHQAGDQCLSKVAQVLQNHFGRPHDVVARYGGEEFVCAVSGISREIARDKAVSMIASIRALGIPHQTSPTSPEVTVSIGLAVADPGFSETVEELISIADAELYQAKKRGRNRLSPE